MRRLWMWMVLLVGVLGTTTAVPHCLVESVCYNDADCPSGCKCQTSTGKCTAVCHADSDCSTGEYCDTGSGDCREAECFSDADCEGNQECRDHRCFSKGDIHCPDDMVAIDNRFCMDIYEASRPDATEGSMGADTSRATSRRGVMPWFPVGLSIARQACSSAGKRLCTLDEWVPACRGENDWDYCYGNDYDPLVCNSIDTFCHCGPGSDCEDRDPCPFPHCRYTCGADLRPMPTGSFPECINSWGVYDICGNVWELIDSDDGMEHFRGGAYNCIDSESLHRCDYDGMNISARGFRCCRDPENQ